MALFHEPGMAAETFFSLVFKNKAAVSGNDAGPRYRINQCIIFRGIKRGICKNDGETAGTTLQEGPYLLVMNDAVLKIKLLCGLSYVSHAPCICIHTFH